MTHLIPLDFTEYMNAPPSGKIAKVQGKKPSSEFVIQCVTHANRIYNILKQTTDIQSIHLVLDWGTGCGRVIRHMPKLFDRKVQLFGYDIDADNIDWSTNNIAGIRFGVCNTKPPLPFDDNYFDAIAAVSVFTHIDTEHQDLWLTELNRVLRPGGVACLSVAGKSVMAFKLRDREYVERVNKHGIFYAARNADLDFFIADKEYYRNTVHSDAYIADHWSRFFTSVQVAERTFGFQDCVICIK